MLSCYGDLTVTPVTSSLGAGGIRAIALSFLGVCQLELERDWSVRLIPH